MGYALGGGSGWVVLTYVPRDGRLMNQYAAEHTQAVAGGVPILALDMYEHAYHLDFGANAKAYVDAFMRNINWAAVYERIAAVRADRPLPHEDPSDQSMPSLSVEELAATVDTIAYEVFCNFSALVPRVLVLELLPSSIASDSPRPSSARKHSSRLRSRFRWLRSA